MKVWHLSSKLKAKFQHQQKFFLMFSLHDLDYKIFNHLHHIIIILMIADFFFNKFKKTFL